MWSAKNGTPKSSRICPWPVYQGALVAMQTHVDWSTCSFLEWVLAVDLQMGTHSPSEERRAAYTAGHHFWCRDHSSECMCDQPPNQLTNQPESFWFHASRCPLFCLAIPALTASLGSVTDIFSCNWDCAYANNFPLRLKTSMWANWDPWPVCLECLAF